MRKNQKLTLFYQVGIMLISRSLKIHARKIKHKLNTYMNESLYKTFYLKQ